MAKSGIHSGFPSQVVSDVEKTSYEYGLKVGRAIENEWFGNTSFQDKRFSDSRDAFHKLRLLSLIHI